MKSSQEIEQNLFNATELIAQFYEEIESFLNILYKYMTTHGFIGRNERLSGSPFGVKNLNRRLLASITTIFLKDMAKADHVTFLRTEKNSVVVNVGSGNYIIMSTR